MPVSIRAGDLLARRYRLDDLLSESGDGRFWRAFDTVLSRPVAVHLIASDDDRASLLLEAAHRSATLVDRRILRVLDARDSDGCVYVVNEWGAGTSLDITLDTDGPLSPRDAAWLVAEVGDTLARAHEAGVAHGRLVPENVLVDHNGEVRIIGFACDAALHGLPPGRRTTDVHDLAGLLYAAMTGRWAGTSTSHVPRAPLENGAVLRPRRVRAGIPRVLDAICDEVLNPSSATRAGRVGHDLTTAAGVTAALVDVVGDHPAPELADTGTLRVPGAATAAPAATDQAPTGAVEMPTQAGIPVFADDDGARTQPADDEHDDGVALLVPRGDRPPPPPEFTQPPDRPLFAPEPADGGPARRPRDPGATVREPAVPVSSRAPSRADTGAGLWPWESATGSGVVAPVRDEDEGPLPGRRWMRLALVLGLVSVLLVGLGAAWQLRGRDAVAGDDDGSPSADASERSPAVPLTGVVARDFDPQGAAPFEENPELAPLAVDGDPATAWRTVVYEQDLGPTGLKTGVGLLLDLGSPTTVRSVRLTLPGGPTTAEVYRTSGEPANVDELEPAASGSSTTDDPTVALRLPDDTASRYVVVWLTSLPPVEGGFQGLVGEVVVAG